MAEKKEMDLKKVKELIDMMKENDLQEIEIVDGDNKILLKRPQAIINQVPMAAAMPVAAAPVACAAPAAADDNLASIESPMVGTFYTAPSPESDAFVTVGSRVEADTVVCIIEAMKVMNEIKAEVSGTIERMVVKNGQAVEFGEALFKVKAD
jgi:acetyl-CoA carboxylase biotin carboxyl carrier protein